MAIVMKRTNPSRLLLPVLVALAVTAMPWPHARAQQAESTSQPAKPDGNKPKEEKGEQAVDRSSVTEHDLTVNGQTLHYRATAGMIVLKDEAGKPKADMFYVAHGKRPAKAEGATGDTAPRPSDGSEAKEGRASADVKSEQSEAAGKSVPVAP